MSEHIFWSFETWSSAIEIRAGDTVTWENRGLEVHNAAANDGSWRSPDLRPGGRYSRTFTAPGEYRYVCTLHIAEEMFGRVTVLPAAAAHRTFIMAAWRS